MDTLLQNVRLGFRGLARTPAFALTAILTLALGIGIATAVFTVADALLLRQLPVHDQDRIVALWGETPGGEFDNYPLGLDDARDFARRTRSLERVSFFAFEGAAPTPIRDGDEIYRIDRALVGGDFFGVLGAQPVLGRALRAEDDASGAAPVAVLSYSAWQQRFGGDPRIIGHQIRTYADGLTYTIVGVMPRGLDYPRGTELWTPVVPSTRPVNLSSVAVDIIGRLAPGAPASRARDELTTFFGRAEASTWQRGLRGVVNTLPRLVLGDTRPALMVFAVASGLLLLITCINVANLLLVRGIARVREIAVRSALGAGRGRIIGQLLTESSILGLAGGALGVAVAAGAVRMFVNFAPVEVPRLDEVHLNGSALAGAIGITAVATLIFALAPALTASRVEMRQVLRSGNRRSASRRSRLAAEVLVAGQVALALLVLSAAGLIARSLLKLERAKLSLDPSHLLIGELAIRYDQYDSTAKQAALLEDLVMRLDATPGVRSVSPVVAVPFSGSGGWDGRLAADGQDAREAAANPVLNMELVGPGYFTTLGVPVLRGRSFTDEDRQGAPPVVMLSESAARYYWPGEDPVGKRLRMGSKLDRSFTVVGIVPDTRYRALREARASVYFPMRQSFFPFMPSALAIRTSVPPASLVPTIRRVIGEASPGVALASAAPFDEFLARPLAQPRLNALLLAVFAGAAAALAAVGLFGVMSTMVRQRRHDLGVRMALGATARDLSRMVMRRALAIAATGAGAGVLGALLANRLLAAMLYEVSPTDGATLAVVAAFLLGVALLASLIPARASTRIEPALALRVEG